MKRLFTWIVAAAVLATVVACGSASAVGLYERVAEASACGETARGSIPSFGSWAPRR